MKEISLEFAPGTNDVVKRTAESLSAENMMIAYRMARHASKTSDIVLVIGEIEPVGFRGMSRAEYVRTALRRNTPAQLAALPIANVSAHKLMKLPESSSAFWLVMESSTHGPSACAIGAIEYDMAVSS